MRHSFSSPASVDPLPPSSCAGMSHCIRTYTLSATYTCCAVLCLCKCMMVRALRSVRAVRACFRVALLAVRFNAFQVSTCLSRTSPPFMHAFLSFLLLFSCMHAPFRYTPHVQFEHQTNSNKLHMILYYVLDTTFVPFGEEPVTLSNAIPYAEASSHLAYLKSLQDGGVYEIVEA